MSILDVYIGHDAREQIAFDVCNYSIVSNSYSNQIAVHKLSPLGIPQFNRPREPHQATDFTYTRFLVPYLNQYKGFALFVDCDFVFINSPVDILKENPHLVDYPLSVCKHPQYIPNSEVKMDGISQAPMWRKNWCSLMLFNCEHPSLAKLTPQFVNQYNPGRGLHQLLWLDKKEVGSIPLNWNCLDGYYHLDNPKAIHYTDGGPWFDGYKDTPYSYVWEYMKNRMLSEIQDNLESKNEA